MRRAIPFLIPIGMTALALTACGGRGSSSSSGPDTHGTIPSNHDGTNESPPNVGAPNGHPNDARDSGGGGALDAGNDASEAPDGGPGGRDGGSSLLGFPCGEETCDPASEYCIGAADDLQCVRIPKGCSAAGACACLNLNIGGRQWRCTNDNGAVVVTPP